MPKGVEHAAFGVCVWVGVEVKKSVMPKGVEHTNAL